MIHNCDLLANCLFPCVYNGPSHNSLCKKNWLQKSEICANVFYPWKVYIIRSAECKGKVSRLVTCVSRLAKVKIRPSRKVSELLHSYYPCSSSVWDFWKSVKTMKPQNKRHSGTIKIFIYTALSKIL